MRSDSSPYLSLAAVVGSILLGACGAGGSLDAPIVLPPSANPILVVTSTPSYVKTLVGLPEQGGFNANNLFNSLPTMFTSAISITGPNASAFSIANNTCGLSLVSNSSCSLVVVFNPTAAGSYAATLNFPNNAPGATQSLPLSASATATPNTIDCSVSTNLCPALAIAGDAISTGLFHGYSDPDVQTDPFSGTTFLAYGWPHTLADGTQVVDLHLSTRATGVAGFTEAGSLYQSATVMQTTSSAYATTNYSSTERISLATATISAVPPQVLWVQAHESYLVKPQGGTYDQVNATSYISVTAVVGSAATAAAVTSTVLSLSAANTPEARLGGTGADASRNVTQSLAGLNTATQRCTTFSQPALLVVTTSSTTLYLLLECNESGNYDAHEHSHFLYSTPAVGSDATKWTWAYVGEIATPAQAVQVATAEGASYNFFTAPKFARIPGSASTVLLVAPATPAPASAVQPLIQYGCRAFYLSGLAPSAFTTDANGTPLVIAKITENDLYTGANEGPGGCAYDAIAPTATGVILGRKYEADPTLGYNVYPVSTGLRVGVFP